MFATAVRFLAKKGKGKGHFTNMNKGMEGQLWSGTLREIVKEKGPLTVSSLWEHAQTSGLKSKRHMKVVLKWMRGQNHVKLVCNHIGDKRSPTDREFLYAYAVTKSERFMRDNADGNGFPASPDTPAPHPDQTPG